MPDKLRIAVVGAGIGARHVEGLIANPETFEIAVICDLNADRAESLAKTCGAKVETAFDILLDDPTLDIIDICLPPNLHAAFGKRVLQSGKHLVMEKPLAGSLADVDALAEAAAAGNRMVFPVFQYRFGHGVAKLRHLIAQGVAGKPFTASVETHWNRQAAYYGVPWRGKFATELGGAVLSHAIHAHDLLTYVMGPIAEVAGFTAVRVNPIETEDTAAIAFKLQSGALATSSITLGSATEISRFRFCFEHLTAESALGPYKPGEEPWSFHARGEGSNHRIDAALESFVAEPQNFAQFFSKIHRTTEENAPPPVSLSEGRASIELATAVYHASNHGEVVRLPLSNDHPGYSGWLP